MARQGVTADRLKRRLVITLGGTDLSSVDRRRAAVQAGGVARMDDRVKRVIVAGVFVTTVVVVLQAASQAIDFRYFNLRLGALNSDKHYSVFGLASLLAQAGLAAACVWRGRRTERHRQAWLGLGALVGGLVIIRGLTTFNATVLALPLACVFWLLCWLTWRDRRAARAVVWAGLILMVASLLLHKVGLAADTSASTDYTWAYQITGMVKHGAELAGWMLVVTGVVAGRIRSVNLPSGRPLLDRTHERGSRL